MKNLSRTTNKAVENCKKQSKRLANLLNIKLSLSQDIVAKSLYFCKNWTDLIGSIHAINCNNPNIELAYITPGCAQEKLKLLEENIPKIAKNLSKHILGNRNRAGVIKLIWELFGFKNKSPNLETIYPSIQTLPWQSAELDSLGEAVLYTAAKINGVTFGLLATRIYAPRLYEICDDNTFVYINEILESTGTSKIIWDEPERWESETIKYIDCRSSNKKIKFPKFSTTKMSPSMKSHQKWFDSLQSIFCSDFERIQIPLNFNTGSYLVYGFPIGGDNTSIPPNWIKLKDNQGNDTLVIQIDSHYMSLEFFDVNPENCRHEGEFKEYFDEVVDNIFAHYPFPSESMKGWKNSKANKLAFIRPSTLFDVDNQNSIKISCEKNEALIKIRTDSSKNSMELIEKIYSRDISIKKGDLDNFYAELPFEEYEGAPSISIEITHKNGYSSYNTVTSSTTLTPENHSFYFMEISTILIKIMEIIPRKKLINAILYGLIIKIDNFNFEEIKDVPFWFLGLKHLEENKMKIFDEIFHQIINHSYFDFMVNSHITIYERDIY